MDMDTVTAMAVIATVVLLQVPLDMARATAKAVPAMDLVNRNSRGPQVRGSNCPVFPFLGFPASWTSLAALFLV